MQQIKLDLKPYSIRVLPKGGWLVGDYPTHQSYGSPYRTKFIFVNSNGYIFKLAGRGIPYFSVKKNEFCVVDYGKNDLEAIWSETGLVNDLKVFKSHNYTVSSHYSNGICVCTNFDLKETVKLFEQIRGLHRKTQPEKYVNSGIGFAFMPQFTYNAIKEGSENKNTIFFLNVDSGEYRSIEALGMKKVKLAYPSYDGLTALAVDEYGNGVIIDNPF